MRDKLVIYEAKCIITEERYIGLTHDFNRRKWEHLNNVKNNIVSKFYNSIRYYGEENFVWTIIDSTKTREELNKKEKYYIKKYNTFYDGLNSTFGGDNLGSGKDHPCFGKTMTEEEKKIRSMRYIGEGNPMYGKRGKETPRFIEKPIENEAKIIREMVLSNKSLNKICDAIKRHKETVLRWISADKELNKYWNEVKRDRVLIDKRILEINKGPVVTARMINEEFDLKGDHKISSKIVLNVRERDI